MSFLQARNALEATESFAQILSGVFRESTNRLLLRLFQKTFKILRAHNTDQEQNCRRREAVAQRSSKTGCLDIQLRMRLLACPRDDGF